MRGGLQSGRRPPFMLSAIVHAACTIPREINVYTPASSQFPYCQITFAAVLVRVRPLVLKNGTLAYV